jgi:hypothetical protein
MGDRVLGPSESTRRRFWRYRFFILPVVAITAAAFIISSASAVHDEGLFELDKNVLDNAAVAGDDWSNVFAGNDSAVTDTGIRSDPAPQSIFTGGGSKDDLGINNDPPNDPWTDGPWSHTDGSVPPKDNITNAYAAAYTSGGDTFIYFGLDRFDTSGSANVGFWFFQGGVAPVSGGTFSGEHQVGDVLVLSEFDQGGTGVTIKVFEWVGTGGDEGGGTLQTLFGGDTGLPADCVGGVSAGDDVCATVNTSSIPDANIPWNYVGKGGTRNMAPGVFFEGGINLTELLPEDVCISNFLAETRSSFEVNATLKDFVHSSFNLCGDKSGVKFHDQDGDGVKDAGEPGLNGWPIKIYNDVDESGDLSAGDTLRETTTTDTIGGVAGSYVFQNLPNGKYIVCEDAQPPAGSGLPTTGWNQSFPVDTNDVCDTTDPIGAGLADDGYAITMSGADDTGNDFGNFRNATIRGAKFKDANANGARDTGEPGLAGWRIHLFGGPGNAVHRHAITNANGNYSFPDLPPGTYTVCEETNGKTGWVQSFPTSGADCTGHTHDGTTPGGPGHSVTVTSGQTAGNRDFGNTPQSKIRVEFLPQATLPNGDPATKATEISCVDSSNNSVGSSQNSNTLTTNNVLTNQSSVVCTITYSDP